MLNISNLPEKSGVYLFKSGDSILYIGKAKNLKKRVASYFKRNISDIKTEYLIKKSDKLEWIITENEVEALILENNLIKKHKPRFNIRLVDDKTYPYIKIDISKEYPSVTVTRKKSNDNALYFGPYTSALKLKQILNFINKNFMLRKCSDSKFKTRSKPCLNYQIAICNAPCCNKISVSQYKENINQTIMFLKGENETLKKSIKEKMLKHSNALEFEKAAFYRDLLKNMETVFEKQIMEGNIFYNKDLFYYENRDNMFHCIMLRIKKGKVIQIDYFKLKDSSIINSSLTEEIIPKYYLHKENIPDKIIVSEKIDKELIKSFFKKNFSKKVEVEIVQNESDKKLLLFAKENITEKIRLEHTMNNLSLLMKKKFKLKNIPKRIDAFDISTFRGKSSVGTRVTFVDLKPEKKYYRKYIIKNIKENFLNDFAMIEEVVGRSCNDYIKKKEYPQLILIDGGKGQLGSAMKALKRYNLQDKIDILAIAKNDRDKYDKIFKINRKNCFNIAGSNELINFLMKVRDEVHRFSITFHRQREEKKLNTSLLTAISGIGEKKSKQLLNYYKNMENIKKAPLQELYSLPFLNKKTAENIYAFFNN